MQATYTLTGASDWPMFIGMAKFFAWSLGGMLFAIIGMIAAFWASWERQNTMNRESDAKRHKDHTENEAAKCAECKAGHDREFSAVWDTLEECCPRDNGRQVRRRKTDGT